MTKNTAAATKQDTSRNSTFHKPASRSEPTRQVRQLDHQLDRRYGAIGISAVAAALRYQSEAKNPAYAPVVHQLDNDSIDAAA